MAARLGPSASGRMRSTTNTALSELGSTPAATAGPACSATVAGKVLAGLVVEGFVLGVLGSRSGHLAYPGVHGGHLGYRLAARKYVPNGFETQPQAAQGGHQLESSQGGSVVEPVLGWASSGGRHDAFVGPEPDGAYRHAGEPGDVTDGE